jgi:putative two-component system response regulator
MELTQTSHSTVLLVDQDAACVDGLANGLRQHGIDTRDCPSGETALKLVQSVRPDAILTEFSVPGLSGIELCKKVKSVGETTNIPVIFVSARADPETIIRAFEAGAADYIRKPFNSSEVAARVRYHLQTRRAQATLQQRNYLLESQQQLIELQNRTLEQHVAQQSSELMARDQALLFALSKLAESRDPENGRHLERLQEYARLLARTMARAEKFAGQIDDAFINNLYAAIPLHDIGKVGIPDSILLKPGALTAEERRIMQMHTVLGSDTLKEVDRRFPGNEFVRMGIDITRSHHERWDGAGYPDGLRGEHIPLSARISAVADVFDILTSRRCYKPAYTNAMAQRLLVTNRGVQFDPDVVDAYVHVQAQFSEIQTRLGDEEPAGEVAGAAAG